MSPPSPAEVQQALTRLRAALEKNGLILSHDSELPSATGLIAGTPLSGSWWGHRQGKLIYAVLSALEEVAWVKLVKGKDTIIQRRLWPALIRIGRSRQSWQLDGLGEDARAVLARVDSATQAVQSGEIRLAPGSRKIGPIVTDLERRLLIHADSVHTESGHHGRVLESWSSFQERAAIAGTELPAVGSALGRLTSAVREALGSADVSRLLPWRPGPND